GLPAELLTRRPSPDANAASPFPGLAAFVCAVARCGRSARPTGAAPRGQLVLQGEGGVVGRIHARQHGQVVLDLAPDPAHGDAEHALAALDQVEDVLGGGALVHRGAVAHEGDAREVVDPALAQGADGYPDLLEGDAGVQQALDDLQHQDVAEAVEALAAGAVRGAHAGLDQPGAGPVVQLAVGDAGGLA